MANTLPNLVTGSSGTILRNLKTPFSPVQFRDFGREDLPDHPVNIIHGAGIVGEWKVSQDPGLAHHVNVQETMRLAEMFCQRSAKGTFLFLSSGHVYGHSEQPVGESAVPNPQSTYAEQKLRAEQTLTDLFRDNSSKSLVIVRIFSILDLYGCAEGTLGHRLSRSLRGDPVTVESSSSMRSFLRPSAAANLVSQLVDLNWSGTTIVNACSDQPDPVSTAITKIFSFYGLELPTNLRLKSKESSAGLIGDNSRLRSMLSLTNVTFP